MHVACCLGVFEVLFKCIVGVVEMLLGYVFWLLLRCVLGIV